MCFSNCVFQLFEQVGQGLSIDAKAQKLALQHWIEAVILLFSFILVSVSALLLHCWSLLRLADLTDDIFMY